MKIKVATTSTGCLDYFEHGLDIDIVRLKILNEGIEYIDGLTINADEFYSKLRENPEWIPQTSQPSVGELVEYFTKLSEEDYDQVLVTTISSSLSGTYNSLRNAANLVEDLIDVIIYDTKTVCFNEGYFAIKARQMLNNNESLNNVLLELDWLRDNNTILFAVDSLTQLVNNGRLTGAKAFMGKLLKIKPILRVNEMGQIVSVERKRNFRKAITSVTDFVEEYTKGSNYEAYVLYAGNPELKTLFNESLKTDLKLENLLEIPSTPVVGAHIGADVVGIGIIKVREDKL